jgi:hypothetical protein
MTLTFDMTVWNKSFQEAFCEHYRCPPERYKRVATRKALPWRVRLLRPLIMLVHPSHFRLDFEFLEQVGQARSWPECNAALSAFSSNNRLRGGFYRNSLKLRASGRRVSRLVERVMGGLRASRYEGR